jgi:hypothetical protein
MAKMKKWLYLFLCVAGWASLYGFFLHLESDVEPVMFANGQQGRWWMIVLLYWIADTVVLLCVARIVARPFGFRMPPGFPFFQFAADGAVLVLLVHIAWLCSDRYLFASLKSVGLASSPRLFIFLGLAWAVVALMKYRQLADLVRRVPQARL